jgi:hypothetical protein
MKWLLAVGGLLLVSAIPAQAQMGGTGGSLGHVNFRGATSYPETQFNAIIVSGTANAYVPTTFAFYDQALAQSQTTARLATSKSLGDIAHEYSRETRPKAKFALVQDNDGNAIIARR